MKAKLIVIGLALGGSTATFALPWQAISGCFEVEYRYNEWRGDTGSAVPFYSETLKESIEIVSANEFHAEFQHYGIHGLSRIKHWSEYWSLVDSGIWKRQVYSPSGALRYECEGRLIDDGQGNHQFYCAGVKAPMPRRDRISGRDYDYILRNHLLHFSTEKWTDSQSNKKMMDEKVESLEIGWNTYRRIDSESCQK